MVTQPSFTCKSSQSQCQFIASTEVCSPPHTQTAQCHFGPRHGRDRSATHPPHPLHCPTTMPASLAVGAWLADSNHRSRDVLSDSIMKRVTARLGKHMLLVSGLYIPLSLPLSDHLLTSVISVQQHFLLCCPLSYSFFDIYFSVFRADCHRVHHISYSIPSYQRPPTAFDFAIPSALDFSPLRLIFVRSASH